ncbi:MAG: hypothetical protein AAFY41_03035 [Bacteroidota bacterium]
MRKILFLIAFIAFTAKGQLVYPTGVINVNTTPGVGIVEQFQPIVEVEKNVLYLDEEWNDLIITIGKEDRKYKYPGRIDLLNDRLELKDANTMKTIQGQVLNYVLVQIPGTMDRFFIRNNTFKDPFNHPSGFYEVLTEGNINLLKLHSFIRLNPSYNPALDVGSKSAEVRKAESFYIMKNNEVSELPKKKKEIINFLGGSAEVIAKEQGLNPKNTADLIELINQL